MPVIVFRGFGVATGVNCAFLIKVSTTLRASIGEGFEENAFFLFNILVYTASRHQSLKSATSAGFSKQSWFLLRRFVFEESK